jgi:hypothetical protein
VYPLDGAHLIFNFLRVLALYTNKKEKKIFLMYKEIQMGAVAMSYMRRGFVIYEEMRKYLVMRRPLVIYDIATDPI